MRRTVSILMIVGAFTVGACGSPTATSTPRPTEVAEPTLPSDALSQMEIAFIGTPRQSEIKELLDRVLALYQLTPGEAAYRQAGDALVAVRIGAVDNGCPGDECSEMEILRYLARERITGVSLTEAIGLASAALALGLD